MYEDENYIKIIVWLLGSGGVLFAIIGGLIVFIFREHITDNNRCFAKNDHEHERFEDKIACKVDKK